MYVWPQNHHLITWCLGLSAFCGCWFFVPLGGWFDSFWLDGWLKGRSLQVPSLLALPDHNPLVNLSTEGESSPYPGSEWLPSLLYLPVPVLFPPNASADFFCTLQGTSACVTHTPPLPFLYPIFYINLFYNKILLPPVCLERLGPVQGWIKGVSLGSSHLSREGGGRQRQCLVSWRRTKPGDWVSLQAAWQ